MMDIDSDLDNLINSGLSTDQSNGFNEHGWTDYLENSFIFQIESQFDHKYHREWHHRYHLYNETINLIITSSSRHWYFGIIFALAYMAIIRVGINHMKLKSPLVLRNQLFIWNIVLAIFSIFGTIRVLPELIYVLNKKGFHHSICNSSYMTDVKIQFWMWLFTWSKVLELGDTAFIILRKKKLIGLHWIHHAVTLFSCFYSFSEMAGSARWFTAMNYLVHSVMYTYYAFRALQFRIPQLVAMSITISQIAQMFAGFYINYLVLYMKLYEIECNSSLKAARVGFTIYVLFLVLFLKFFVATYIVLPTRRDKKIA